MRIGTWNMEGRRSADALTFLGDQACDVLLLTEVPTGLALQGYGMTEARPLMRAGVHWAAVASRSPLDDLVSPHPATTAAVIDGTTFVSSILPWRGCGDVAPWTGTDHLTRTTATLAALEPFLRSQDRLVWGGDWNHALHGPERAGSKAARAYLLRLVEELSLTVPTAILAHRIPGIFSIDHIATPTSQPADAAVRVQATQGERRLSDHDLYRIDMKL